MGQAKNNPKIKAYIAKGYKVDGSPLAAADGKQFVVTLTKDGKSITQGGCIDFNVDQGVSSDTFNEITSIDKATLQSWVETRVGTTRINEMKAEIETTINTLPDDWQITPGV